jgi:hypothetical protein
MDLTKVESLSNVIVTHTFALDGNTFTQTLNVPFIPDFMIIKNVSYIPADDDTPIIYFLYSDMSPDCLASVVVCATGEGIINQPFINNPNSLIQLKKPISGTVTFIFKDSLTTAVQTLGGQISVQIEFVRFKAEVPQKTY